MFLWIIILLLGCVVGCVLVIKSRRTGTGFITAQSYAQQRSRPGPVATDTRPAVARRDYRAVSIRCGTGACHAARVLEGKRGLPEQLPRLPLSSCDAEHCRCTLKRHADRRDPDDRRALYAGMHGIQQANQKDRRAENDRRSRAADDEMRAFKITYG